MTISNPQGKTEGGGAVEPVADTGALKPLDAAPPGAPERAISATMTEKEWQAVHDARAALPGTPPDGYSFIPEAELGGRAWDVYRERMDPWREVGMTHARLTRVDWPERGVWIEVWKERPDKEAEFHPPLTADGATKRQAPGAS